MEELAHGLLRALCFDTSWGYAPTRIELMAHWDGGVNGSLPENISLSLLGEAFRGLVTQGAIQEWRGRVIFPGNEPLVTEHESREELFPRKLRKARRVAAWLRRLDGVRFVALCNTTAQAHARDQGDLDFFVVTRPGVIWQTRAWASLPFKIFGDRPSENDEKQDAVCLSFFVDERVLDLSSLFLSDDDPYFRHWFLSLLPLYDEGVMKDLWEANTSIRRQHPFAVPWIMSPNIQRSPSALRIPSSLSLESFARKLQESAFPSSLKQSMNQGTQVVANDHVLKFHVEDGRERFRERYYEMCARYGVTP